ncbi:MAG: hypothetical protein WD469_04080 [Paenibacillaceae bacterium]
MQGLVKDLFKEGDWVSGKSVNDEKFHGYIEGLDIVKGTVRVKITACDNESSLGRTAECFISTLDALPLDILNHQGHLFNLIDIALSVRDKAWFMELTTRLQTAKVPKIKQSKASS